MNEHPRDVTLPSIQDYYSFTQLRADRWSALRECAESMAKDGVAGAKGKRLGSRRTASCTAVPRLKD